MKWLAALLSCASAACIQPTAISGELNGDGGWDCSGVGQAVPADVPCQSGSEPSGCFIAADGRWSYVAGYDVVRPGSFDVEIDRLRCEVDIINLGYDVHSKIGSVLETVVSPGGVRRGQRFSRFLRGVPKLRWLPDKSILLDNWRDEEYVGGKAIWVPTNAAPVELGSCKENFTWTHAMQDDGVMVVMTPYTCSYDMPCQWGQALVAELRPDGSSDQRCIWPTHAYTSIRPRWWMLKSDGREFGGRSGPHWLETQLNGLEIGSTRSLFLAPAARGIHSIAHLGMSDGPRFFVETAGGQMEFTALSETDGELALKRRVIDSEPVRTPTRPEDIVFHRGRVLWLNMNFDSRDYYLVVLNPDEARVKRILLPTKAVAGRDDVRLLSTDEHLYQFEEVREGPFGPGPVEYWIRRVVELPD
jgi:hypothetical protein